MNQRWTIDPFPLHWPEGWERTRRPKRAAYKVSMAQARDELVTELTRFGAKHILITSNLPLRRDGLPLATRAKIVDPGVAVYFEREEEEYCVPCDAWDSVEANMRAIGLTIENLRAIQRHGTRQMVAAAASGYRALPAQAGGTGWWDLLGIPTDSSVDAIERRYRELARSMHPDHGGSQEAFAALTEAYRQALSSKP